MNKTKDWNVCFEIGLNHMGCYENVEKNIKESRVQEIPCAISIQIREETFYTGSKKQLELSLEEYIRIRNLCSELGIPFGLALGPLVELEWLNSSELSPDFIKLIYKATNDIDFMTRVNKLFLCDKYFSVGLSEYSYIKEKIIPIMQRDDMLIHTSLSHATADQNLLEIAKLESLGKAVCFGQHAIDQEICFAAIGAGAKKIFIYIGDKSLDLPDYYHAISPSEVLDFYSRCSACFVAMQPGEYSGKSLKIKFLG